MAFELGITSNFLVDGASTGTRRTVDLCMAYIYAHVHFDDLDLHARLEWVGKGKNSVLNYFDNKASNKHCYKYNGRLFFT